MKRYVPGHRRIAEAGPDFYPTPAWATELLLAHEAFEGSIWEPACGEGDMAEVMMRFGYAVRSTDLYDRGYKCADAGFDFTDVTNVDEGEAHNVITNPPFALAEQFFDVAYKAAAYKVALLLRTAFVESRRRYDYIFSNRPPVRIWTFSERLSMYPKGHDVQGGGTTSYSWFVWDKQDKSGRTELLWFPPGHKPKGRGNAN